MTTNNTPTSTPAERGTQRAVDALLQEQAESQQEQTQAQNQAMLEEIDQFLSEEAPAAPKRNWRWMPIAATLAIGGFGGWMLQDQFGSSNQIDQLAQNAESNPDEPPSLGASPSSQPLVPEQLDRLRGLTGRQADPSLLASTNEEQALAEQANSTLPPTSTLDDAAFASRLESLGEWAELGAWRLAARAFATLEAAAQNQPERQEQLASVREALLSTLVPPLPNYQPEEELSEEQIQQELALHAAANALAQGRLQQAVGIYQALKTPAETQELAEQGLELCEFLYTYAENKPLAAGEHPWPSWQEALSPKVAPSHFLAAVMGEVNQSGVIRLRQGITVAEAIEQAGGKTQFASGRNATLTRPQEGKALLALETEKAQNFVLQEGDVLEIWEKGMMRPESEMEARENLEVVFQLSKNDENDLLRVALVQYANLEFDAAKETLQRIIAKDPEHQKALLGLKQIEQAIKDSQDEKSERGAGYYRAQVLQGLEWSPDYREVEKNNIAVGGEVNEAGSFEFFEGQTLTEAIVLAGGSSQFASRRVSIVRGAQEILLDLSKEEDQKFALQSGDYIEVREQGVVGARKPLQDGKQLLQVEAEVIVDAFAPEEADVEEAVTLQAMHAPSASSAAPAPEAINRPSTIQGMLEPAPQDSFGSVDGFGMAGEVQGQQGQASAPEMSVEPAPMAMGFGFADSPSPTAEIEDRVVRLSSPTPMVLDEIPPTPARKLSGRARIGGLKRDLNANLSAGGGGGGGEVTSTEAYAYNQTRAELLSKVHSSWALPVQGEVGRKENDRSLNVVDTEEIEQEINIIRNRLKLAEAQFRSGQLDKAKENYERVLLIDPYNLAARRGLERIAQDINQPINPQFDGWKEQAWASPWQEPLSTFSIDVDTASYDNTLRLLREQRPVPAASVRLEEFINAFDYNLPQPEPTGAKGEFAEGKPPFSITLETSPCPWAEEERLLRIGLQGYAVDALERAPANLVFLVDTSGSMDQADKLDLAVASLRHMLKGLRDDDRIAIVTYAGNAGVTLPSTSLKDREFIDQALKSLSAGGSTNGAGGITVAYQEAQKHFIEGGNNRVILCTDGDFNVGLSGQGELGDFVAEKAQKGVYLTVCGFGMGNLNDAMLEEITNRGNGLYHAIHDSGTAQRIFGKDLLGSLVTIAKDVKIQVEFNPTQVAEYRLIGYDNRILKARDFDDDTVDAGDIGSGHSVTALYQIRPVEAGGAGKQRGGLRYQRAAIEGQAAAELGQVRLRWKKPDEDVSQLIEVPFVDEGKDLIAATAEHRFAAGVASFGLLMRQSEHSGKANLLEAAALIQNGLSHDPDGRRAQLLQVVKVLHEKQQAKIDELRKQLEELEKQTGAEE